MVRSLLYLTGFVGAVYGSNYAQFEICLLNSSLTPNQLIFQSSSAEYNTLNFQWNLRTSVAPKGFVKVKDVQQTSDLVKCAVQNQVVLVARSGGHSYNKYSLNSNSTVVVDLSLMKEFSMEGESGIVSLGPGNLLGEVYYKLWFSGKFGLPAGSCPTVGIAGHTLGGGYGLSSRKYGLMIDNLIEAELVNSKGEIVKANANCNSELFWGLRGGGSGNFGIVTKFKFQAFKLESNVLRLSLAYPFSKFMEVYDALQKFSQGNPDLAITSTAYIHPQDGFSISTIINSGSEEQNEKLAQGMLTQFPEGYRTTNFKESLTFIDMVKTYANLAKVQTVEDLNKVTLQDNPKQYFDAKSFYNDHLLTTQQIQTLMTTIQQAPQGGFLLMDMQNGKIAQTAADATSFPNRNNLFSYQAVAQIDTLDKGIQATQWLDKFSEMVYSNNLVTGASYFNYLDTKVEGGLNRYYGANLNRLVELKKQVDPNNFFKYDLSIPLTL